MIMINRTVQYEECNVQLDFKKECVMLHLYPVDLHDRGPIFRRGGVLMSYGGNGWTFWPCFKVLWFNDTIDFLIKKLLILGFV